MKLVPRPEDLYDREREWNDLARFAAAERPRLRLGVLYGRRRFGKSFRLHLDGLREDATEVPEPHSYPAYVEVPA